IGRRAARTRPTHERTRGTVNRRKVVALLFRKIVLTTLAAATLPFTTQAQTRTTRRAPVRPAANAPRANAAVGINITAADMSLLIDGLGFPPEARDQLTESAEER